MPSLLSPSPTGHDDRRRWPRASLIAALIAVALTGGAGGAGLLAATGALDRGASTTAVVQPSSNVGAGFAVPSDHVSAELADHRPGDELDVPLRRGGGRATVTVRLGMQPATSGSGSSGA